MIDMSWEDVIKNVRDTPMGDMEELTEGNIRATKIAAKKAVEEIFELRDRLDNVVQECEDAINKIIDNSRMMNTGEMKMLWVDAKYAEKLLEGIRKTALGR